MRISDWSSDVCSSDLIEPGTDASIGNGSHADLTPWPVTVRPARCSSFVRGAPLLHLESVATRYRPSGQRLRRSRDATQGRRDSSVPHRDQPVARSEEHTSELQSLMRISYAVFCLKKKKTNKTEQ